MGNPIPKTKSKWPKLLLRKSPPRKSRQEGRCQEGRCQEGRQEGRCQEGREEGRRQEGCCQEGCQEGRRQEMISLNLPIHNCSRHHLLKLSGDVFEPQP